MKRLNRPIAGIVLLCLILVAGALLLLAAPAPIPPAPGATVPLYAGARSVAVEETLVEGRSWRTTTYQADAPPAAVLAFYRQQLGAAGWQPNNVVPLPDGQFFTWTHDCPIYGLDVVARAITATTTVTLTLRDDGCQ